MFLRGGEDGRVIERCTRINPARSGALEEGDHAVEEVRDVVGDGALAPSGVPRLRRSTLKPAVENLIASLREHPGDPAQVAPEDALPQPRLGARRHPDRYQFSTFHDVTPPRRSATRIVPIQAGGC